MTSLPKLLLCLNTEDQNIQEMKLPVTFRWYETWFLALQGEHKLEALKNKMREGSSGNYLHYRLKR